MLQRFRGVFLLLLSLVLGFATSASAVEYPGGDLVQLGHMSLGAAVPSGIFVATQEYSNVTNFLGQAFSNGGAANQAGNTITRLVADDITPTGANAGLQVTTIRFSVANLNAVNVTCRARVRFWNADGAGGGPGTYYSLPAAVGFSFNPFTFAPGVTTLSGTLTAGSFNMPGAPFWAGITFDDNTGTTGATLAQMNNMGQGIFNPPTVGSSADGAFQTTAAGSFFPTANPAGSPIGFGGNPVANFGWEFVVDAPVPTNNTTWGRVKNLYR